MDFVHLEMKEIPFEGPQPTWAGEHPLTGGFCFGLEDGTVRFMGRDCAPGPAIKVVDSEEAINGAAFTPELAGFSTPGEILIHHRTGPFGPFDKGFSYGGGAHSIIPTSSGGLIAPLGPSGLLHVESLGDRGYSLREIRPSGEELYFYRIAGAGSTESGDEVFACAGRKGGLLAVTVGPNGGPSRIIDWKGQEPGTGRALDIVDACSLRSAEHPRAVASLGIGGTVHLTLDVLGHERPINLRFPQLRGTAYSILESNGHVFVLTSQRLCVLPGLASSFLRGERTGDRIPTLNLSVDPVDASIAYAEFLFLIQAESVALFDVANLSACLESGRADRPASEDVEGPSLREEPLFTREDANVTWSVSPAPELLLSTAVP